MYVCTPSATIAPSGLFLPSPGDFAMTLRDLLRDRIAPLKNLADRSQKMYESTLDRFRDFLGHEPTVEDLDDLTAAKFLRWRATTKHSPFKLISPASLAKDSAHLRSLWTWLAALTVAMAISGLVLLGADRIRRVLGESVVAASGKLMGLVLTAIAVEMVLAGLKRYFFDAA